jgi:prepilin peptidase CpaA
MELNYTVLALAVLVAAAGVQDVLSRRISNIFPLAIVVLFLVATTLGGWSAQVWQHGASFLLVFSIGAILFQRGLLGGGDVKLWAAVALWFKLSQLPLLVLSITLVGGVLAFLSLATRKFRNSRGAAPTANWKVARSVPYGVAIALGTMLSITAYDVVPAASPPPSGLEKLNNSMLDMVRTDQHRP